jgi:CO/xanthine dehydrogenase Mo-binding subunit
MAALGGWAEIVPHERNALAEDRSVAPGRDEPLAAPDPRDRGGVRRPHRAFAIADEVWHDSGAYIRTHGVVVADLTLSMLPGPYRVPAYRGTAHVVLTARTPCGTYRGPGRYEGSFARERLLDLAADELGLDPLDLRRRNLLSPDELPLEFAFGYSVVQFLDGGRNRNSRDPDAA